MFTAAFFGSWFAYVAITFALGFVWHLLVFKNLYHRLAIYTRLDDPIIPLGLLSMLIQGAVLAYLFPKIVDIQGSAFEGIAFSLLIGLFLASSAVIAEAAKQRVTSLRIWFVVESLYYFIQFLLTGLAMSYIYATL
jgi:hypothetical protein